MSYGNRKRQYPQQRQRGRAFSGLKLRLLIAGAIVLYTLVSYYSKGVKNPVTGEVQRVDMTIKDEIKLGLMPSLQWAPNRLIAKPIGA